MRFGRAGGPGGPVIGVVLGRGLGFRLALGAGVGGRGVGPVIGVVLGCGLGLGVELGRGLVPGAGVGNGTLGGGTGAVTLGTDAIGCGVDAAGGVATLGAETVGFSTAVAKMRVSWRRAWSWLSPSAGNGVAGVGFRSAWVRSLAASRAASADDVFGITE